MPFWTKKNEYDAYDNDSYFTQEPVAPQTPVTPAPTTPAAEGLSLGGNNIELKVARPTSFREVTTIAKYLLDGCTVFLNLEAADRETTRRITDFLTGVSFVAECQMKRVSVTTFIISPKNVDVSGTPNLGV